MLAGDDDRRLLRHALSAERITGPAQPHLYVAGPVAVDTTGASEDRLGELVDLCIDLTGRLTSTLPRSVRAGLSAGQLSALALLQPGGLTMAAFARNLGLSHVAAMTLADSLVDAGAAERHYRRSDYWIVWLVPTSAAAVMAHEYQSGEHALFAALLNSSPPYRGSPVIRVIEALSDLMTGFDSAPQSPSAPAGSVASQTIASMVYTSDAQPIRSGIRIWILTWLL